MKLGISIVLMLAAAALEVVAVILWWPSLDAGVAGAVVGHPLALALHAAGAYLFSVAAAMNASRPMAVFYFVLSFVLPLLGMLTALGLNRILSDDSESAGEEDELEVGNPIMGKVKPGNAVAYLKPIARLMREEDSGSIGRLILGLSKGGEAERGHQVLRRYQQDGDVELQFYAQNAQRGATDGLEGQLKNLSVRLAEDPAQEGVRSALAEVLIALAGRRSTSGSDANAYVRRALEHLRKLPEGARRSALEVRGYLLVREPAGARAALEKLPEGDLRRPRLEAEVLYAERDWEKLAACAARLESTDIQLRTAREFWRKTA